MGAPQCPALQDVDTRQRWQLGVGLTKLAQSQESQLDTRRNTQTVLDALAELTFSVVKPVYTYRNLKRIHVGTGALFQIQGRHFLVTAAHVLDERQSGPLYLQDLPLQSGYWSGNGADVAIYPLSDSDRAALGGGNFIMEDAIKAASAEVDVSCHVIGYPASKNKNFSNAATIIRPEIHMIQTSMAPVQPEDDAHHFRVRYARNMFSPVGMSGGLVVTYGRVDSPRMEVIGLPIEVHTRELNIKCVRFTTILNSIRRALDKSMLCAQPDLNPIP